MTDHNQRPIAIRLLFVAVAVVCFGQAYRIAAAVGGRAEAASVAQTSTVSAPSLPRYVEKPIEEIRAGDLVLARNEVTGELASKRVVRTFQRTSDHIRELTIRSSLGGLQTIETTDEHPFWVTGAGWVSAAKLSAGAALLDSEGGIATVVANAHIPRSDGVPVYNFEVDDWHTYHVKAGHATGPPLLVHNNCVNPYHARAPGGGVFVELDTSFAGRGGAPTRSVANRNLTRAEWKALHRQQRLQRPAHIGMGQGANQTVDRIAGEIDGAVSQAGRILDSGGHGGTYWGRRYQQALAGGDGMPLHVIEGNARQQIADRLLRNNHYFRESGVIMNHGHQLGSRNRRFNLFRPDYQIPLDDSARSFGIIDLTTEAAGPKIWNYYHSETGTPILYNIFWR